MLNVNRRNLLASAAASAVCGGSQAIANRLSKPPTKRPWTVPLTLNNLDKSNGYSTPYVSYGHAFGDGDIPANGSVTLTDSNGNAVAVQMDAVSLWPSRSPRFVVLSHACAETFAPGTSVTYQVGSASTAPNNQPAADWGSSPEATLAANSNFLVEDSGFDAHASTYPISLNTI